MNVLHAGSKPLSSSVSRALVILADLTEYHKLGGAPGHDLSYMIERGDVCRELVDARRAQLRIWLDAPDTKLSRKHRKHRKEAKNCLRDISEI
jgi:hypothetical protein